MMFPRCARVCALLGLLAATPAMAAGPEGAPADSLTTVLPAVTVSGEKAELPSPDRTRIDAPRLAVQDPGSLADVAGLIPSARVVTNSRGETPLMIRGAPERHVQVFLDGIPLNLPWDERADLRILRDPFSAKPHVLFYATKRVGGDVSDFAAIKLLKFDIN